MMPVETEALPELPSTRAREQRPVRGYRPELDVVRFLAFLLVFIHHFFPRNGAPAKSSLYLLNSFANACGMGLCLFFALSAYLITELLLKERETTQVISVKNFYTRRALRIW